MPAKAVVIDVPCTFCATIVSKQGGKHFERAEKHFCDRKCAHAYRKQEARKDVEVRFWSKVDKTPGQGPNGDCWIYREYKFKHASKQYSPIVACGLITSGLGFETRKTRQTWLPFCKNHKCANPAHLIPHLKPDKWKGIAVICSDCGTEFRRRSYHHNATIRKYGLGHKLYCSKYCKRRSEKKIKTYECKHCSASFERYETTQDQRAKPGWKIYCSDICHKAAKVLQKESVEDALVRFWSRVDKTPGHGPEGDCWLWTGGTTRGYGTFHYLDRCKGAHIHSLQFHLGRPITEGLLVRHLCNFSKCVRPDHLAEGTHKDNFDDMEKAGRRVIKGKLEPPQVRLIYKSFHLLGYRVIRLAEMFDVSPPTIRHIVYDRTYKHLNLPELLKEARIDSEINLSEDSCGEEKEKQREGAQEVCL